MEEDKSYAVGHLTIGYILGKASAKTVKAQINVPMIFMLSVLPDIDIIIPFLSHRGPTHSIVVYFLIFAPVFFLYRFKAIPYFLALVQHSLLGDFIVAGPVQLLWPFSLQYYGMKMGIESYVNITMELASFAIGLVIMLKTKDMVRFLQPNRENLILAVPTLTVLLPTLAGFPLDVPILLIPPHLFFIFLFLASTIIGIWKATIWNRLVPK